MFERTTLEEACIKIVGADRYKEYHQILSNLLLLNYSFIEENDPRLSAKITAVLFDDESVDKAHLVCKFIEEANMDNSFSRSELEYTKKLLEIDPVLENSTLIVHQIKMQIVETGYIELLKNNLKPYWDKYGGRVELKK